MGIFNFLNSMSSDPDPIQDTLHGIENEMVSLSKSHDLWDDFRSSDAWLYEKHRLSGNDFPNQMIKNFIYFREHSREISKVLTFYLTGNSNRLKELYNYYFNTNEIEYDVLEGCIKSTAHERVPSIISFINSEISVNNITETFKQYCNSNGHYLSLRMKEDFDYIPYEEYEGHKNKLSDLSGEDFVNYLGSHCLACKKTGIYRYMLYTKLTQSPEYFGIFRGEDEATLLAKLEDRANKLAVEAMRDLKKEVP